MCFDHRALFYHSSRASIVIITHVTSICRTVRATGSSPGQLLVTGHSPHGQYPAPEHSLPGNPPDIRPPGLLTTG